MSELKLADSEEAAALAYEPHAEIYVQEFDEVVRVSHHSIALGMQLTRLEAAIPTVSRYNNRTGRDEPVREVVVKFRRKTGQWFISVGSVSAAKAALVDAIREVADRLER